MARKGIFVCTIVLFFLRFGRATYCTDRSDCDQWSGESCCLDGVCRRTCDSCSYDFQCGTGEKCCYGGDCLSSCPTTESPWTYAIPVSFSPPENYLTDFPTSATVAPISYCHFDSDCELDDVCCDGDCMVACSSSWSGGGIVGVVSTIGVFGAIFFFVACYYCAWCPYYRYRSSGAVIVVRRVRVPYQPFVTTTQTTMTQNIPPPPNYNQPPPPGCQPPPPYSSISQQPAQHPPPAPASGQPSAAPKVTA